MVELGKKIGAIDETFWGSRTEAKFLEAFKGLYPLDKLKAAYKKLPKSKPATRITTKEIVADLEKVVDLAKQVVSLKDKKKKKDGSVLDSGES